jgi:hypothetical protein
MLVAGELPGVRQAAGADRVEPPRVSSRVAEYREYATGPLFAVRYLESSGGAGRPL